MHTLSNVPLLSEAPCADVKTEARYTGADGAGGHPMGGTAHSCKSVTWMEDVLTGIQQSTAPAGVRERISDESDALKWFEVDALPDRTDEALRRLVARSVQRIA